MFQWFSNRFLLEFAFPPLWYYATVLYFGNYYLKDSRDRPRLAASTIVVSKNWVTFPAYYMVYSYHYQQLLHLCMLLFQISNQCVSLVAKSNLVSGFNLLCHSLGYHACCFLLAPWLVTSIYHKLRIVNSYKLHVMMCILFVHCD